MGEKAAAQVPPAGITWTNRPKVDGFQMGCGFLGFIMVILQIGIALYIIAGVNGRVDPISALGDTCPTGWHPVGYHCLQKELRDEAYAKFVSGYCSSARRLETFDIELLHDESHMELLHEEHLVKTESHRRLSRRLAAEDDTMWDRFIQNVHVPLVLTPLVLLVGVLWIVLLQKFAKACIYGALLLAVVFFVFMSVFPTLITVAVCDKGTEVASISNSEVGQLLCTMDGGAFKTKSGEFVWVFLVPGLIIGVLTWWFKKKINVAALCLSKCCLCLQQRPSVICASLGVFAAFVVYLGMWVGFALSFFSHFEITCNEVSLQPEVTVKDNGTLMKIMGILIVPTYIYFEMMILVVVACGVGGWYFQDGADTPGNPAVTGLKWAYSSSSGAIFLATLITWPIIEIRNYIHSFWGKFALFPCLPCSWVYYIFYIIWCCFLRAYLAFTKFMLIAHTFHGGDIFTTARNAWIVLKKHLGGAVVTDTIAAYVLNLGVWIMSVSFAFIAWVWMEQSMGKGFLAQMFSATTDGSGVLVMVVMLLGGISWLCRHSLFTLIVCAFCGQYLKGETFSDVHPFMCGVFIGAICNIIFSFLAKIIQTGMDTIFYCFALEAEHAVSQSREGFAEITAMIKENIVQPLPKYLEATEGDAVYVQQSEST